ncbi:tetratricopeptide repeat protein [Thiospirochaeta perfilievii]|uniref:Tetratricopeptide repeat protein n=1 Tax=Thiospirochaeta perfilievii TaxID=252967 RepID=A0A5C1Q8C3_9SPIO|nr:tetratricopeptide repeat protein [Thiospirochaeta perfilievii]QEN03209.1 tetratricopeptide repeat protein [Thiospirochaeta perfilievii]
MKETTKKNSNQIISDFLSNNKKILLTVLSVAVVLIIAFGVYSTVSQNKINEMINSTTELDNMYDEVLNSNGDKEAFVSYGNKLIEEYKGTKAEVIAYSRLASYFFDEKNFEKALEYYTKAYVNFPKDMAASVYMFNAAMCNEELGNVDQAIEVLTNLVKTYKSNDLESADLSPDVPEAIFNLGRLFESKGDLTKAIENYELLVAEYQSYNLSNLAKTRLLTIK